MKKASWLSALAGLGLLLSQTAAAAPEDMALPALLEGDYTLYSVIDKPDNAQVRYYYANPAALEGARGGGDLPDGAFLLVEVYEAAKDAEGKLLEGPEGHLLKGGLAFYTAMEKRAGWGAAVAEDLRNGDWNYAVFTQAGGLKDGFEQAKCLECHKPEAGTDYIFTYGLLVAKAEAMAPAAASPAQSAAVTAGDPERGKALFKRCSACHSAAADGKHKIGPNLNGVVGRKVASAAGYKYSKALAGLNHSWDAETLGRWLTAPRTFAKGTKMAFPGLKKPQDRADVIAYLSSLGN